MLRLGRASTTSCNRASPARCATARSPISQRLQPDVIATGNIGCITQIGAATQTPVVHTVELVDWAQGGPAPFATAGESRLRAG